MSVKYDYNNIREREETSSFLSSGTEMDKTKDEYIYIHICTPSNSGIYCKKESINIT